MGLYSEPSSLQANTLGIIRYLRLLLSCKYSRTPGACDLSVLAGAQVTVADVLPLRLYLPGSFWVKKLLEQLQPLSTKFAFNVVIAISITYCFVAASAHHIAVLGSYASIDKETTETRAVEDEECCL